MATALQQQLAAIATKSTHQLDLKAQKAQHSKSLLFEPRDAATQSFDTIYQICIEGFEELCRLDSRFVPFARNIFNEQSKHEDRTRMSAQQNQELDGVLEKLLGLLGSRMLLKPAIKAAEWLVRRFRVHEYNTETVLFTFLPYHSASIFPTLLSILPNELPPKFRFLHPYVASLQCPPRHTVVAAFIKSGELFTNYSRYILGVAKAKHQSTIVLNFWASIMAQSVDGMVNATRSGRESVQRQKEEDLLLRILPILQSALNTRGVSDLFLSACVVIVILATKASLADKVIRALMEAVAGGLTNDTLREGLMCLAALSEERQLLHLPKAVVKALVRHDPDLAQLHQIAVTSRVDRLLTGASLSAVDIIAKKNEQQMLAFIKTCLDSRLLSAEETKLVFGSALRAAFKNSAEPAIDGTHIISLIAEYAEREDCAMLISDAAQEINMDLAKVYPKLALQALGKDVQAEEEDESTPLGITAEQIPGEKPGLGQLADLPSDERSFLDANHTRTFDEYIAAFQERMFVDQNISTFKSDALKEGSLVRLPSFFSFLARVWSSATSSATRAQACRIASDQLQHLADQNNPGVDFQALLPYLLVALADDSKSVRSAAASAFRALGKLYRSTPIKHEIPIWSQSTAYGAESTRVHWMSTGEVHQFIDQALTNSLDDCVIDSNHLVVALVNMLSGQHDTPKSACKELKGSLRSSMTAFLASHVPVTPIVGVQTKLLEILSKLGKAGSAARLILLPYARDQIFSPASGSLKTALINGLSHRSADEIQLLQQVAATAGFLESTAAFAQLRHIWHNMKETTQNDLADWLLDLSLSSSDEVRTEANEVLRKVMLPTSVLVRMVENLPAAYDLQEQSASKRQRNTKLFETPRSGSVDRERLNSSMRRITNVLELIEESNPERHAPLLKGLFHVLAELNHYKTLLNSELVYLQGLVINNLLAVVNGLRASDSKVIGHTYVRADLIVECVRTTSSTQVHHAALLLMSALASWAPDLVLHSVMPLFTFMSSTILKQSDEYSAHVTEQTVSCIIPPLAASLKKGGKDLLTGAADLLLSFTAAFEHVPLHRRAGLFHHLVKTLGDRSALFAVVAMLVERYPRDPAVLPFVADLMDEFPVPVQLQACQSYLALVLDTTQIKRGLSNVILGYAEKDQEEAEASTNVLLDGIAYIFARERLHKRLLKGLRKGDDEASQIRSMYVDLLHKSMDLALKMSLDEQNLHGHADAVLTALLGVMPTSDFIETSAQLMQTGSDEMRRKVFASLEQRASKARRGDVEMQKIFIDVLPNCGVFISDGQPSTTRRAAIACIDHIAEKFGKTDRDAVLEAARLVASSAGLGSDVDDLKSTALLCLASMVEVLGDEFVPIFQLAIDHSITALRYVLDGDRMKDDESTNSTLYRASFSFAIAVLDYIPWMLSLEQLSALLELAEASATSVDTLIDDSEISRQFCMLAAKKISAGMLLDAMDRTWHNPPALAARQSLGMLQQLVEYHKKSTIKNHSQQLFKLMSKAFALRGHLDMQPDLKTAGILESVNDVAMKMVLKLDDSTFRPFFIHITEWAADDSDGLSTSRYISLYSFALVLFDQLKALVTSYYGYLLEHTVDVFRSPDTTDSNGRKLLDIVLQALAASFTHDQDGFWQSPSHFEPIMQPLVNLLKNSKNVRADDYIIPAITELAIAVSSPEHYKAMNGLMMSLMRDEQAAVRLAAIKCERSITDKLGLDWLALLPEMLPVISELQEDDDSSVEREVLRWIAQIEGVTGESLEHMLQ